MSWNIGIPVFGNLSVTYTACCLSPKIPADFAPSSSHSKLSDFQSLFDKVCVLLFLGSELREAQNLNTGSVVVLLYFENNFCPNQLEYLAEAISN